MVDDWTPTTPLARAVDFAGFSYDPSQDIIYSKMNPLQRRFGYAYGYDVNALLMGANIDAEPIFFDYGGKHWMIELWKGQYGLESGAEIGIYTRSPSAPAYFSVLDAALGKRDYDSNPTHSLFYACAGDEDMLTMSFTLLRNGIPLLTRGPEKHWWLTGFKWGVYSQPEELVVRASLVLPVPDMRQAFTTALAAMGYPYQVHGDTVTFDFAKPVTHQPRLTNPIRPAVEVEDQAIVAAYEGFGMPNNDPNQVGAALANRIEGMVLGKSTDFLGQAFAAAFKEAGEAADQVAKVLANELDLAATTVVSWVTDAGYGLRDWIESLYTAVEETFTMNFSCAIEIDNVAYGGRLPAQLTRTDFGVKERSIFKVKCGHYFVEPPVTIRPGTLTRFYLKDNFGYEGAEGWATYTYLDESNRQRTVTFTYGCPTSTDDNYARCDDPSFRVYARSGDSLAWRTSVPGSGHPLSVACVFNSGPAPS